MFSVTLNKKIDEIPGIPGLQMRHFWNKRSAESFNWVWSENPLTKSLDLSFAVAMLPILGIDARDASSCRHIVSRWMPTKRAA